MEHKAQALFSLLFGFGFANIMTRLEAKGAPSHIFLRRLGVLFIFGFVDMYLLWMGDILLPYATMGFLLYFTRHWRTRTLLLVGLPVAVLGRPVRVAIIEIFYNGKSALNAIFEKGAAIRGEIFMQSDYGAFVAELWRASWVEFWTQPVMLAFFAQVLGRFMLGSWIFRKGWFSDIAAHRDLFVRTARIALPVGLAITGYATFNEEFGFMPGWTGRTLEQLGTLVLACGYGAAIVLLNLAGRMQFLFAGFRAAGRMALTNYMMQSLFFVFAIYGFGLGLLPWLGATLSLVLAIAFYAVQMIASHWWLQRYNFGPLEWLWRGLTYGERPAMRRAALA